MIKRDRVFSKENVAAISNAYWSTSTCLREIDDLSDSTVCKGRDFIRALFDELRESHLLLLKTRSESAPDEG